MLSQRQPHGYLLDALIPAEALTGFDPHEHPRLGFTYAAIDRAREKLGFEPTTPIEVGVPKFIEWYKTHADLIDEIRTASTR